MIQTSAELTHGQKASRTFSQAINRSNDIGVGPKAKQNGRTTNSGKSTF
jgi:hypothetical protein